MDNRELLAYVRQLEKRLARIERQDRAAGGGASFNDTEGDPVAVGTAADGTSTYAARRDHTHALADGSVIAEILDDDGAGSGLDADLLDGSHAAAFATAGHTHGTDWLLLDGTSTMTGDIDAGNNDLLNVMNGKIAILTTDRIEGPAAPATSIDLGDTLGSPIVFTGGSGKLMYLDANGLGVGAQSDSHDLHVAGDARVTTEVQTPIVRADGAGGLRLEDDGDNLGIFIKDGGQVGVGHANPATLFHAKASADGEIARFEVDDGSDTALFLLYGYTNDYATTFQQDSILFYASTSVAALHIAAAKSGGRIGFVTDGVPTSTTERMRLTSTGLGISAGGDTFDPRGPLHVHQGTGGCAHFVKTGIVGSAQTLIPDGAGDVVRGCRIMGAGYSSAPAPFDISSFIAPTGNYDIVVGSSTLRFSVSSAGALTVIRQAGTHTFQISVWVIWL